MMGMTKLFIFNTLFPVFSIRIPQLEAINAVFAQAKQLYNICYTSTEGGEHGIRTQR
jgi:hypothetical protein